MNIYDTTTKKTFKGEKGKTYNISFKVKVTKSDNIPLQFYVVNCGRTYETALVNINNSSTAIVPTGSKQQAFFSTDCNFTHVNAMKVLYSQVSAKKAGAEFTAPTDGWVTVSAEWTADGTNFPIIGVMANNKTKIAGLTDYAEVLVDAEHQHVSQLLVEAQKKPALVAERDEVLVG